MKNFYKNKIFLSVIITFLVFFIIFYLSPLFAGINERMNNSFVYIKNTVQRNSGQTTINEDIVVVRIDEKTLEELGSFPFSRENYAKVIDNLSADGVSVVGLDIIFADENKQNPEIDEILAKSIKRAGNVVLGGALISEQVENKNIGVIEKPIQKFYENAFAFGYFHPSSPENTLNVVSFEPSSEFPNKDLSISRYNHFSVSLLQAYYSKLYNKNFINFYESDKNYFYYREGNGVPYSRPGSNEVLINFIPVSSSGTGKFSYISFIDVFNNNFEKGFFKDKIVIIGATAKGIKDIFYTANGVEYGVFVLANILNTMMTKNFLIYFNENIEWIFVFLLIMLTVYFILSKNGIFTVFINISLIFLIVIVYPLIIYVFSHYILLHLFEIFLALFLSISIGYLTKYLIENKNKGKLSKALSEYVSKQIVNEILSNSGEINLDGERKKIAIFFSDIEGFTTISEKFTPKKLMSFLREYLSNMSNVIIDNSGFINKFEGDAIMALWGAFIKSENDVYNACLSAVKQQEALKILNEKWTAEGLPEIKARIGLHYGNATLGNIGVSGKKIEYTALGDNVNLGSRLEGVNKFYGTFICASESVYNKVRGSFEFRYLDKITVKGKERAIRIYELLSLKNELDQTREKIRKEFNKAIKVFNSRNFLEAKTIFENIYKEFRDPPSKTYIERCDFYLQNPPKNDEELVWNYDTK